ncbi:MAG: lipopolysaccharide biosynthesis protein [Phycisphaerae bacterium]
MADSPPSPQQPKTPSTAVNVITNWIWYALTIVSGFLIPRLIEDKQGRELLGIWDLCWTLVIYVNLLSMGVVSAMSRFAARNRVSSDWHATNLSYNSSTLLLSISFLAAVTLVSAVNWVQVMLPPDTPAALVNEGWLISVVLVTAAAVQLPAGPLNGIITGFERFDCLNAIRWVRDFVMLIGMIASLYLGYGLLALAMINLVTEVGASIAKWFVARRLCPALQLSPRFCKLVVMRKLLIFGGKSAVQEFARGGLYSAASFIVSRRLGEGPMAIYSRQRNLVMHAHRFTKQFSQVFVPKSAALQAGADQNALRELLIVSGRWGFFIAVPIVALLIIAGDDLVEVWMKSTDYRKPMVMLCLALGHLPALGQMSAYSVLMGMGKHGIASAIELFTAITAIIVMLVIAPYAKDLMLTISLILGLSVATSGGLLIPMYACRLLKLSQLEYWAKTIGPPILAGLPFIAALILVQVFGSHSAKERLLLSVTIGAVVNGFVYWFFVIPPLFREKIRNRLLFAKARVGSA